MRRRSFFRREPVNAAMSSSSRWHGRPAASGARGSVLVMDDAGEYEPTFAAIVHWLRDHRARLTRDGQRLAVVLDIDETALLNKAGRVHRNVIIHAFYTELRRLGVEVFFVTARPEQYRAHTLSQLRRLEYDAHAGLFMMPDAGQDPAAFKRNVRRRLVEQGGYRVLANVGDQWTDMSGGYYDMGIKLPEDDADDDTRPSPPKR